MLAELTPEQCDWIAENAPFQLAAAPVDRHCPGCDHNHDRPAANHLALIPWHHDAAPVPYLHNHPDYLARGPRTTRRFVRVDV